MLRALANGAMALVSAAVSGPTISPAPAAAAAVAAATAPSDVLLVSRVSNASAGPGWNARRAASSMDWPSCAFAPLRGNSTATRRPAGAVGGAMASGPRP